MTELVTATGDAQPGAEEFNGAVNFLLEKLNDGGVQLYNVSNPSSPQLTGTFAPMTPTPYDGFQASVSALAWDPSGSGLLAVGVMSAQEEGFVVRVNPDGSLPGSWVTWSQQGGPSLKPVALSAAFGQDPKGNPVVAFGLDDGTLQLINLTVTGETDTVAHSGAGFACPNKGAVAWSPTRNRSRFMKAGDPIFIVLASLPPS